MSQAAAPKLPGVSPAAKKRSFSLSYQIEHAKRSAAAQVGGLGGNGSREVKLQEVPMSAKPRPQLWAVNPTQYQSEARSAFNHPKHIYSI